VGALKPLSVLYSEPLSPKSHLYIAFCGLPEPSDEAVPCTKTAWPAEIVVSPRGDDRRWGGGAGVVRDPIRRRRPAGVSSCRSR
jgi:hypothetical protein